LRLSPYGSKQHNDPPCHENNRQHVDKTCMEDLQERVDDETPN